MKGMFVKVVADSISPAGDRITTFHLRYPRYIHAQVLRYRLAAHNVRSSRAVPVDRMCAEVLREPVKPAQWKANRRGMQPGDALEGWRATAASFGWRGASLTAVAWAKYMDWVGVHKQWANRILETFLFVDDLMTATCKSHDKEPWENMIEQRVTTKGAQDEITTLVSGIAYALRESVPEIAVVHWPYYTHDLEDEEAPSVCAARCARISYEPWDGSGRDASKDLELAAKLRRNGHWSPFEHVAFANPGHQSGCMYGWETLRESYEGLA